jgi:hypothetical protein
MADSVYRLVLAVATWPLVALLLVLALLCVTGFQKRNDTLAAAASAPGGEKPTLDSRGWYSAQTAHDVLGRLGERGRRLYAWTEVSLDLVFPFIYGTLLAALLVHLWDEPWGRWIVLAPLVAAAFDLLENVTIAALALTFNSEQVSPLGGVAGLFTAVKTGALLLSLALVAIGAVWRLATHSAG